MTTDRTARTPLARLAAFIHHESTAGFVLVSAAALAIVVYNIEGLRAHYDLLLQSEVAVTFGGHGLRKSLLHWINDGLMAVFFFLVGLEIKREVLEGNLSSRDQVLLPSVAALGGIALPALIYSFFNWGSAEFMRGWAIPAATDIAFALGALALVGTRAPLTLKVFLLTLATLDDLAAIVIIALFYTASLSIWSLTLAAAAVAVLVAFNLAHASRTALYVFVGVAMWIFVLKSGVHATLAGVALALTIPLKRSDGEPFIHALEEGLHPYIKFLILPLFAFANAGIPLDGFALDKLTQSVPLGIAAGLVAGKPLGIIAAVFIVVRLGLGRLPEGCGWHHLIGAGCLAGIGFTMSLFIGSLAFESESMMQSVRVGVIAGSLVSTVLGIAVLSLVPRKE